MGCIKTKKRNTKLMYKFIARELLLTLGVLAAPFVPFVVKANNGLPNSHGNLAGGRYPAIAKTAPHRASKHTISQPDQTGYDIIKSLPLGFVKDGSVDYTLYLQEALNLHDNLVFPGFPILVNDNGLVIGSNKTISFLPGAKIVLLPSSKKKYNIIKIDRATNVTINNAVIEGDRQTHLGTEGESGMGIGIYSSNNITINNPTVSYCWGDGIYLGSSAGAAAVNNNVRIYNARLLHNRRNGMSVITANQLVLSAPYAAYSDGVAPMCGIDFEPNSPDNELKNITVLNAVTESNQGPGISVGLRNLYGRGNAGVDIQFISPKDNGSAVGLKATATLTRRLGSEIINGNINVVNPVWAKNSSSPTFFNLPDQNIKLLIKKPSIIDVDGRALSNKAALDNMMYKTHINGNANCSITF
jgi:parallel beta-helix repeat protein